MGWSGPAIRPGFDNRPGGLYCQAQSQSLSSGLWIWDLDFGPGFWTWISDFVPPTSPPPPLFSFSEPTRENTRLRLVTLLIVRPP